MVVFVVVLLFFISDSKLRIFVFLDYWLDNSSDLYSSRWLWETVMSIYLKNNHQDLSMMKIIFSCIPIPKPPIRLRLGWNLKATTWLISFSYSSQHSLTSRDETEPINPACVRITKLDKNVCWGFAERARRSCLHHRVHTKHTVSDGKFGCLCVCVCVMCVCALCMCEVQTVPVQPHVGGNSSANS